MKESSMFTAMAAILYQHSVIRFLQLSPKCLRVRG